MSEVFPSRQLFCFCFLLALCDDMNGCGHACMHACEHACMHARVNVYVCACADMYCIKTCGCVGMCVCVRMCGYVLYGRKICSTRACIPCSLVCAGVLCFVLFLVCLISP